MTWRWYPDPSFIEKYRLDIPSGMFQSDIVTVGIKAITTGEFSLS